MIKTENGHSGKTQHVINMRNYIEMWKAAAQLLDVTK
jgi:hypothetical protein